MLSIRSWLTSRYALLMLASLVAFALALFIARWSGAVQEATGLAEERARLAQLILRRTSDAGAPITVPGRLTEPLPEQVLRRPQLEPRVRELLTAVGGYLWVLADTLLYESPAARALSGTDLANLNQALNDMRVREARSTRIRLQESGVLVERREILPNGQEWRVVAGAQLSDVRVPPLELLATALVILPVVLAMSIGGAHLIALRAMEPLGRITKEVVDIADGRSLHRRLHAESSHVEWSQLTDQLNGMISRLELSFAALRRFTADASHELKTPLAVLRANVERAMHARGNEQMVALEEALQETTRMADLVESLLTLARADEGRFDIVREPVELDAVAREAFETAIILGEHAGLNVSMPQTDPCIVEGDRTRLRQLFLNLVTNAIKYTPRGGEVELLLRAREDVVSFSVRDTGIGIAAVDLPNIFDRFFRADRVRSRMGERGGFGLGLSISQWIAQAHGGTLTAHSRLHRGSTFTVTLPLAGTTGTEHRESADRRASEPAPVT